MSTARRPADPRPRRERLEAVLARDGARCVWCGRPFDAELVRPTVEHVIPRLKGGPAWFENELAACSRCNRLRGHRGPLEWLDDCERRGGQRRARPYLAAQLRRLDRREAQAARAVPWDAAH